MKPNNTKPPYISIWYGALAGSFATTALSQATLDHGMGTLANVVAALGMLWLSCSYGRRGL
jgi:hypothetical protein